MPLEQIVRGSGRAIGSAAKDKHLHGDDRFDIAADRLRQLLEGILSELKRAKLPGMAGASKQASYQDFQFDSDALKDGVPMKATAPALGALFANSAYGAYKALSPDGMRDYDRFLELGNYSARRGVPLGLIQPSQVGNMTLLRHIQPKTVSGRLVDDVIRRVPNGTIDVGSLSGISPSLLGRDALLPTRTAILSLLSPTDAAREVAGIGKNRMLSSSPSRVLRGAGLSLGMLGAALNKDQETAGYAALAGTGLSIPALLGELQKSRGADTLLHNMRPGTTSRLGRMMRYRRLLPMALFSAAPGLAYLYKRKNDMYNKPLFG